MTFVIAGTREQARKWRRRQKLPHTDVRYVGSAIALRGMLRGCHQLCVVGDWRQRRDLGEIFTELRQLGITPPAI